jgi:hypothetical protein
MLEPLPRRIELALTVLWPDARLQACDSFKNDCGLVTRDVSNCWVMVMLNELLQLLRKG